MTSLVIYPVILKSDIKDHLKAITIFSVPVPNLILQFGVIITISIFSILFHTGHIYSIIPGGNAFLIILDCSHPQRPFTAPVGAPLLLASPDFMKVFEHSYLYTISLRVSGQREWFSQFPSCPNASFQGTFPLSSLIHLWTYIMWIVMIHR